MDFYAVLDEIRKLLQRRGRVTYRALKVQFQLDDEHLEALKEELIEAEQLAVDEQGKVLVWTGVQRRNRHWPPSQPPARNGRPCHTLRNIWPRRSSPRAAPWKANVNR